MLDFVHQLLANTVCHLELLRSGTMDLLEPLLKQLQLRAAELSQVINLSGFVTKYYTFRIADHVIIAASPDEFLQYQLLNPLVWVTCQMTRQPAIESVLQWKSPSSTIHDRFLISSVLLNLYVGRVAQGFLLCDYSCLQSVANYVSTNC